MREVRLEITLGISGFAAQGNAEFRAREIIDKIGELLRLLGIEFRFRQVD